MKCLLITSYFPPIIGGSSTVYGTLHKYGNEKISVLTAKRDSQNKKLISRSKLNNIHLVSYLQPPNIKCHNTLHSIWILIRHDLPIQILLLIKTIKLVREKNFDVVCIGELQTLGWLEVALRIFTSAKILLYIHGEELTTKTTSRFLGRYAKYYLSKADGVVCVSNFTKKILVDQFDVSKDKIKLITNGIDLDKFKNNTEHNTIIDQYKTPGKLLIFSAGRLIERKGLDYAIEAMKLVSAKYPHVHLVIAGEGEKLNAYNNKIIELNLENTVTMTGRLTHDELVSFYSHCDIFLMPNRELENGDTEGFGLVFLEANAFKKPVIGGNAGGAVDAILNEKTGLLVDSTSTVAIAAAINRLVENDNLRQTMGNNGYAWALQNDAKQKVNQFIKYCDYITR